VCVLRPLPPDAPPPLGVYGESSGSVVPDAPVSRTYTLEHSCFTRRATKPSHESSAAIPSYCVMSSHPAPPSPHLSRKTLGHPLLAVEVGPASLQDALFAHRGDVRRSVLCVRYRYDASFPILVVVQGFASHAAASTHCGGAFRPVCDKVNRTCDKCETGVLCERHNSRLQRREFVGYTVPGSSPRHVPPQHTYDPLWTS
jgi:hypothetical protein